MIVIPAIDLKDGKCVRLRQGRMDDATVFGSDPAEIARRYEAAGATWIHVVDLDGSVAGRPVNSSMIEGIVKAVSASVELGGGIRDEATAAAYFDLGIKRVIMGTAAVREPELFRSLCQRFPGGMALGLDARDGLVAVQGWTQCTEKRAEEMAEEYQDMGAAAIIFTDIIRDGMQTGVNLEATGRLARSVRIPVIASGGVAGLEDIERLLPLEKDGVIGVITGRAVLSGALDLAAAIRLAGG